MISKAKPFVLSVLISLGVGALSALITGGNMDLYSSVKSPPLAPAPILFPLVWTALYILMGVSAALVFKRDTSSVQARYSALTVYAVSLVLNFFWSIIFFNLRAFFAAFIWLLALLGTIILTVFKYRRISISAAYLQLPYAVWVLFAGYLNFGIWWLNR